MRRIGSDEGLDAQRKAYLMQNIMASRYIVAQQRRLQGAPATTGATGTADRRCFHDAHHDVLGCAHYKRKYAAPTCCLTSVSSQHLLSSGRWLQGNLPSTAADLRKCERLFAVMLLAIAQAARTWSGLFLSAG